jgi:hypothetical protein
MTIRDSDARRGQVVLEVNADEVDDLASAHIGRSKKRPKRKHDRHGEARPPRPLYPLRGEIERYSRGN